MAVVPVFGYVLQAGARQLQLGGVYLCSTASEVIKMKNEKRKRKI